MDEEPRDDADRDDEAPDRDPPDPEADARDDFLAVLERDPAPPDVPDEEPPDEADFDPVLARLDAFFRVPAVREVPERDDPPLDPPPDPPEAPAERDEEARDPLAAPPLRPPFLALAFDVERPRPEPLASPPPLDLLTVAQARPSASPASTPRSS